MDNKILDTSVSWEELQQKCLEVFGPTALFGPNKCVKNIAEGKGNVARVCLVQPDWASDIKPEKFLVKICIIPKDPNTGEETDYASTQRKLHNTECTAYRILEKHKHEDLAIPEIYASVFFTEDSIEIGYILMEYLEGAVIKYIYENIGVKEVKQVLRAIAALQAVSLKFCPEEKENLSFNPLYEIFSHLKLPNSAKSNDTVTTGGIVSKFISGTYLENKARRYFKCLSEIYDLDFMYTRMKTELGISPVFVHGDAWSNNFLWKRTENGLQLVTTFDFQTAYMGMPGGDVMRVISSFLSGKDRRKNWDELIEYFYETFLNYIGSAPPPYTLEQLRENIKRYYPLVRLVFAIPQSFDQNKEKFDEETREKVKDLLLEKMDSILDEIHDCMERNRQLKEKK